MDEKYNPNAYKQAYIITNYLVDIGEIVISQNLLDTLESRMNKEYYYDLNDINNIELLPDTEKILSYIYLQYKIDAKEKEKILKLTKQLKKIIIGEEKEETENSSSMLLDLNSLNFFKKLKIKLNRIISYC